jgi:hypothetical protein
MLPPNAAQVFPVTIPTEQIDNNEKLRSNSWTCPVSFTSIKTGSWSRPVIVPFSESDDEFEVFSWFSTVAMMADKILYKQK